MRLFGIITIIVVMLADQVSKWFVLEHIFRPRLAIGHTLTFLEWIKDAPLRFPWIELQQMPFFSLTMVWNKGISFGMLAGGGVLFLIIATMAIAGAFFFWMWRSKARMETLALALVIGGAFGNVMDRVRFGAVADFMDFYAGAHHFPAFNVADSAISIGVLLLLIHSLFFAQKNA